MVRAAPDDAAVTPFELRPSLLVKRKSPGAAHAGGGPTVRDMHPAEALAVASEACDTWEPVECTCSRVRHTRRRKADWMDPSKGRVEGVVVFHRAESAPFGSRENRNRNKAFRRL